MKRFLFLLFICSFCIGCTTNELEKNSAEGELMNEEIDLNGKKYQLSFIDDFDTEKLNTKKWEKCPEWQRQDYGGYWSNSCSKIENSMLVIEAKKSGSSLYSGAVRSSNRFEQGYGVYKIKFKINKKTEGLWYAFWLMSHTVDAIGKGAVNGGEIDIFEVIPNDPWEEEGHKTYLNSAVHWDGYGSNHKAYGSKFYIDDSFYNEWHTVTFEWTPEYYKAYLDDSTTPYWDTEGEAEKYGGIVATENYIKITAEFGKWAGTIDESALPACMYVDWVKVYRPAE